MAMPVILAIQDTEIKKMEVQSQPGQTVHENPILKKTNRKTGLVEWLKW
jgi:hypothetical protein